jgi:peroxiredoxin
LLIHQHFIDFICTVFQSDYIRCQTILMKNILFILSLLFGLPALSQTPASLKLNENTIVKDSSGNLYPYAIWQALLRKGSYSLKAENPKNVNTAFYLVELSEKEKASRLERMGKPRESEAFTNGQKIPLFNLVDIEGRKIKLKEAAGKIIVMNFWFINCKPCRMEIPELNEMVAQFKNNDKVIFVGIALDQRADLRAFLTETPFAYSIIDNGRFEADKYGVKLYPTHVIVDPEGKVYFHTSGLAPNTVPWIKKSIEELLAKASGTAAR